MARPSWLVARRSIRPLRTMAGPPVMVSSTHCRVRCGVQAARLPAGGAQHRAGSVGRLGQMEQVGAFGVVEFQRPGNGVQDLSADAGQDAAFEFGVVLDTDACQGGDLAAAQSGDAALPDVG